MYVIFKKYFETHHPCTYTVVSSINKVLTYKLILNNNDLLKYWVFYEISVCTCTRIHYRVTI